MTATDSSTEAAGWAPTSALAKVVEVAGFTYDPAQDIILSRMNALQRNFGYAYQYDAAAMLMAANIDCEPVFFDAHGKSWMIELWKGQYGLETGCEIGVYNRGPNDPAYYQILDAVVGARPHDPDPAHSRYFACASDAELLTMSMTLKRDGLPVFTRGPEPHWWLTGFKWGIYSDPKQLTVDATIEFPDAEMLNAFVAALTALGYSPEVNGLAVSFEFADPKTYQPRLHSPLLPEVVAQDQAIVAAYDAFGVPDNDPNKIVGDAALTIEAAIASRGVDFFGRLLAQAFKNAGRTAEAVAEFLVSEMEIVAQDVQRWITNAGYDLAAWVRSVVEMLLEPIEMDDSSTVEIDNGTAGTPGPLLVRTGYGPTDPSSNDGHYAVPPPDVIFPGDRMRFLLADKKLNPNGSEGWVSYRYDRDGSPVTVTFSYSCPYVFWHDNKAASSDKSFEVWGQSGSDRTWHRGVPKSGHPLRAAFVFGGGQPSS